MIELVLTHKDFYVVNKPADVGFHDEQDETGFFNQCAKHFAESLFPVHRLDKLTSGLLILARNKTAATWFQQAFTEKRIAKLYLALADAKPKKKQGSIIGDMTKSRNSQWKLTKTKQNPAITRFFSWGIEQQDITGLRLFLIKPETGKTHQIRVALKSLGSAILGDKLYNGATSDRGYLHALALKFDYQGEQIELCQVPTQGQYFLKHKEFIAQQTECAFDNNWPGGK